jgi:hypothetical protein
MKDKYILYRFYEIESSTIDFLRGEGEFANRPSHLVDKQIKAHDKHKNIHTNKYIGIIIKLGEEQYFAPLTHDVDSSTGKRN